MPSCWLSSAIRPARAGRPHGARWAALAVKVDLIPGQRIGIPGHIGQQPQIRYGGR